MRNISLIVASLFATQAMALPEISQVISGQVSSQVNAEQLSIIQTSQQAEVNFSQFDIDANEVVLIQQPNAQALLLGNISNEQTSVIAGQLHANGQLFLVNPQGFLITEGAQIDTQALVLSTLSAVQQGQDRWQLEQGGSAATIVNRGSIASAEGGSVTLLAAKIINSGDISSPKGQVQLANAKQALLQFGGVNGFTLALEQAELDSLIENNGLISADGGLIMLTQAQTDVLLSQQILQRGIVRADRIDNSGGEIRLTSAGDVLNSGTLSAKSGAITVDANRFALDRSAVIDISAQGADAGKLSVLAGDKFVLAPQSLIDASANGEFNAGEVVLKALDSAVFAQGASILAAAEFGQGGFVEVSGANNVHVQGRVDTRSKRYRASEFLIDPIDIEISNQSNAVDFSGGVFSAQASGAQIDVADINANLQTASVTITTTGGGNEQGDIHVNAAIDLNGGASNTLRLNADGNIMVNQDIADSVLGDSDAVQLAMTAGGNINIASTARVDVGDGKIALTAGGNMNLTGLRSSSTAGDAIVVTTGNGLFDAGDINADITSPGGVAILQAVGFIDEFERIDLNAPGAVLPPLVVENPIDDIIDSIVETQELDDIPVDSSNETLGQVFAQVFACQLNNLRSECQQDLALQQFLQQLLVGDGLPQ